jgi:acyl-coenzyme A thioesterase PaaI-like protein
MTDFNDDNKCFVCGKGNPVGLQLDFRPQGTGPGVEADVLFPAHLQGWQATVHGGLLATVLDEVMVKAATAVGSTCVTAELTVKYRKPTATGVSYLLSGRILEDRGRILTAESCLCDASGVLHAQATGKLFKIR